MQVNGWHVPDSLIPTVPAEALPTEGLRWRALELVAPADVRVILLGQDPYPQPPVGELPGKATGLAFGLPRGWPKVNSSILSIVEEVWGGPLRPEGPLGGWLSDWLTLEGWAEQGVLLLNTQLSVMPERPGSHAGVWDAVVSSILQQALRPGRVALAFGAKARERLRREIRKSQAPVELVAVSHPCKFSCTRGSRLAPAFKGSQVFARANAYLPPGKQVDWRRIPDRPQVPPNSDELV